MVGRLALAKELLELVVDVALIARLANCGWKYEVQVLPGSANREPHLQRQRALGAEGFGRGADQRDQSLAALGFWNGQPPGASVDSLERVSDGDDAVVQVDVRPAECERLADPQASAEK